MGKKKKTKKQQPSAKIKQTEQPIALSVAEKAVHASESSVEPPVSQHAAAVKEHVSTPEQLPQSRLAKVKKAVAPERPAIVVERQFKTATSPKSRMQRMLPDLLRALLALSVIAFGIAIWFQPPIFEASFPHTTFQHRGKGVQEAILYRPIAMPERYYIELPEKLEDRYQWFAVDRRREVVAACEEPSHRFLGKRAIRRGGALGLDLEFRKLDGSEWLIHFYADAIVFSNNVLSVQLEIKKSDTENTHE